MLLCGPLRYLVIPLCSALANQFEYTPYNSTDRINVTKTDAADRKEGQMERQTDIRQMHYAYR